MTSVIQDLPRIADAIRAGLPTFGIVEQGKVRPIRHRKAISQRAEP